MKISLIAAVSSNLAIGFNNKIPWHLSADLKKFKQITLGHPIIMGRKTYESFSGPLPGRTNIIISQNPAYRQEGCLVFSNIEKALATACKKCTEIFIAGGSSVYELTLPRADFIYLTQIHKFFRGDVFFPMIKQKEWQVVARKNIKYDKTIDFSYSFIKLKKIPQQK